MMFPNKSAVDGGRDQQIFHLSKMLSPELTTTVMSFSGGKDCAAKALWWLNVKFNSPHLLLLRVMKKLEKFPQPARSMNFQELWNVCYAKLSQSEL